MTTLKETEVIRESLEVLLSSAPFHTIVVLLNFCTLEYTKSSSQAIIFSRCLQL